MRTDFQRNPAQCDGTVSFKQSGVLLNESIGHGNAALCYEDWKILQCGDIILDELMERLASFEYH